MGQNPIILTLDAGGTNFSFSAIKGGKSLEKSFSLPSNAHDLDQCLDSLKSGFSKLIDSMDEAPSAISFAFPGPADYKNGVIGDLPNLPAFRGGIPLGPFLEDAFRLPVFINNDGDLFTLGESKSGFLKHVNDLLEGAGNHRRYKNLIGITLGTGFGVGVTVNGVLLEGDNSSAAEGWKLRNKLHSYTSIEDTVSIRSVRRMYAEQIAMDPAKSPDPKTIFEIAMGRKEGVREAAVESYLRFGEAAGDAIASILTIVDGLIVIGGGLSGAFPLFSRSLLDELNGFFTMLDGRKDPRVIQQIFNLEDDYQTKKFLESEAEEVLIPGTEKTVRYQKEKKSAIGLSRLGTSEAVSLGAYHYALDQLK
jgi:glucokinase